MIINIAYGLPGSGKTIYLKSLTGEYIDLDNKPIQQIKSVIESLNDGVYNIDVFLRNPKDFITYLHTIHPGLTVNLQVIDTPKKICLQRDNCRPGFRQSTKLINNMKL